MIWGLSPEGGQPARTKSGSLGFFISGGLRSLVLKINLRRLEGLGHRGTPTIGGLGVVGKSGA